MLEKTFNEISVLIENFSLIYDKVRLVNPVHKKVHGINDKPIILNKGKSIPIENCYKVWGRNMPCENCISIQALKTDETIIKLELCNNKFYMIMSVPIKVEETLLVLELVKIVVAENFFNKKTNLIPHIENIKNSIYSLGEAALRDELTHLYNRKYINNKLPTDMIESIRDHYPLAIIIADIDFFKKVNDKYGHLVGDEILKGFACTLKRNIRSTDWAARYGGEEFLICLKGVRSDAVYSIAEKIRDRVENEKYKSSVGAISITASFGIYNLDNKYIAMSELIKRADSNLYKAKKLGRNKVYDINTGC